MLQRRHPEFVEIGGHHREPRFSGERVVCRAAPRAQARHPAALRLWPRLPHQGRSGPHSRPTFRPPYVERVGIDPQQVAGPSCDEHVPRPARRAGRSEYAAQVAHRCVKRATACRAAVRRPTSRRRAGWSPQRGWRAAAASRGAQLLGWRQGSTPGRRQRLKRGRAPRNSNTPPHDQQPARIVSAVQCRFQSPTARTRPPGSRVSPGLDQVGP